MLLWDLDASIKNKIGFAFAFHTYRFIWLVRICFKFTWIKFTPYLYLISFVSHCTKSEGNTEAGFKIKKEVSLSFIAQGQPHSL